MLAWIHIGQRCLLGPPAWAHIGQRCMLPCRKQIENSILWLALPCGEGPGWFPTPNRESVYTLSIPGVWAPELTGTTRYDPKYPKTAQTDTSLVRQRCLLPGKDACCCCLLDGFQAGSGHFLVHHTERRAGPPHLLHVVGGYVLTAGTWHPPRSFSLAVRYGRKFGKMGNVTKE